MTKSMFRNWGQVLLTCLLIVTASRADAGTPVTVAFSGQGTGTSSGPFSGYFIYDQSQTGVNGVFEFKGDVKLHVIDYQTATQPEVLAADVGCQPFTIKTSGSSYHQFTLTATAPPGTTVKIVLPTPSYTLSPTTLPFCDPNVFPSNASSGSTFTLSGGTTFTGSITNLSCSTPPTLTGPSPQGPPVPVCVYEYPVACPPYYVCQPRSACCFSGLFRRRSCR